MRDDHDDGINAQPLFKGAPSPAQQFLARGLCVLAATFGLGCAVFRLTADFSVGSKQHYTPTEVFLGNVGSGVFIVGGVAAFVALGVGIIYGAFGVCAWLWWAATTPRGKPEPMDGIDEGRVG